MKVILKTNEIGIFQLSSAIFIIFNDFHDIL